MMFVKMKTGPHRSTLCLRTDASDQSYFNKEKNGKTTTAV